MNRLDQIAAGRKVPPHLPKPGDPPPKWPPVLRRTWLDGWASGWWDGYRRAWEEARELGRAS